MYKVRPRYKSCTYFGKIRVDLKDASQKELKAVYELDKKLVEKVADKEKPKKGKESE